MAEEERTPEVNRLIILGKEKGFLTYGDLNSTLPAEMATTERITSLMVMFGEMDIEVIDSPEGERYQRMPSEGEGGAEESRKMSEGMNRCAGRAKRRANCRKMKPEDLEAL